MEKTSSGFFTTNLGERIKTLLITIAGVILVALYEMFKEGGTIPTTGEEWKGILMKGAYAGATYLIVTFLGNGKPTGLEKIIEGEKEVREMEVVTEKEKE